MLGNTRKRSNRWNRVLTFRRPTITFRIFAESAGKRNSRFGGARTFRNRPHREPLAQLPRLDFPPRRDLQVAIGRPLPG